MNNQTRSDRIVDLMAEYYHELDLAQQHMANAQEYKKKILAVARVGKYGSYIVGQCQSVEIKVKAYTRHGYKYIRKGKKQ